MTLFQKIEESIRLGYLIHFDKEPMNNISIKVFDGDVMKETWLPISDHLREDRLVDCITFMIENLDNEKNNEGNITRP